MTIVLSVLLRYTDSDYTFGFSMAQKLNFAFCFLSGTTCSYKVNGQSISSHFIFLSYVFSLIFSFHLMSVVRLSSVKLYTFQSIPLKEEFEETKGVIRIRISKKNRTIYLVGARCSR
jgi:hypothetical protein